MATSIGATKRPDGDLEPAWEIAYLFPAQGAWSEDDYLSLTKGTNHLVELSQGHVEVLPMPTRIHQRIVFFLARLLYGFLTTQRLGTVIFAPLRVRLWEGKFREPDLVVVLAEHRDREQETYFDGADLVIEVVSDDDPDRDLVTKRREYAQAAIAEYWIVEPRVETISVLQLDRDHYVEHGRFGRGAAAASALLPGLSVDVAAMLDDAADQDQA